MAQPEKKIVKIVDADIHTRGANVIQNGDIGALAVKSVEASPMDSTQLNASFSFTNEDNIVDHTTVITKTIEGTDYERTVSYNAGGDVLSITAWS